ncbi:hypothetical protein J9303_00580 [Bacillaceae bacterium Marseille-Q3522]|nr:hypothetical protein [Bacillaceae bacterium Marseille-Q3522]
MNSLKDFQYFLLDNYNVTLTFHPDVRHDLKAINKGSRSSILVLIHRRVKQGLLFVPDGVAKFLDGDLHGYAKIKPRAMNLRIIYQPVKHNDHIEMYILAIGPRDQMKVYDIAVSRL